MKHHISLITVFVLLNLLIGRLFQESLNVICFSELIAIAISSFAFWSLSAPTIKRFSLKKSSEKITNKFWLQSGLGISTTFINILISQGLILFLMIYVYDCTSPSFSFINASLTNNIAVNLLCYFSLVYFFIETNKTKSAVFQDNKSSAYMEILLSSGNKTKKVQLHEINFIEASNNCIVINTKKGQFVRYQSLKSFLVEFEWDGFKRIHKSYIVNVNQINSIEKNKNGDGIIILNDENKIKFSRTYRHSILN